MSSGSAPQRGISAEDVVDLLSRYYAHITLAVLMGFMLWIRLRPIDRFRGRDLHHWQAVDPYYHWRSTEWTVRNFPFTMPYEVFTGYPTGNYVGQFGTLFDQFIATIAMVIGLGSPSQSQVALAALIGVPLIAAAVAIPVFFIGRRLAGTTPALFGVAVLALTPGQFLTRSTTGMFQHHAAEVLMMAVSVLAMMIALRVAQQEQPVWELVLDRDFQAMKRPAKYSALAGLTIAIYGWVWPPAVLIVGIFGVFFLVAIVIDQVRGHSPEPVVFVGSVSLGVATLAYLPLVEVWAFDSVTSADLFIPFGTIAVVVACLLLGVLSRVWFTRNLSPIQYPAAVASIGLVGLAAVWLILPDIYSFFMTNLTSRIIPIDPGVGAQTVAEARPPDPVGEFFFDEYGLSFFTMILGLAALAGRPFLGKSYRVEHTLIIVWSLFLISMTLTQVRFSYYLVLAVAVLNAYLVKLILDWVDLPSLDSIRSIKGYQVLTMVLVMMLLFIPLLPPVAAVSAWDVSDGASPSNDAIVWEESNLFLKDNTPEVGDWGEHSNADQLDIWGSHSHPGNGYDYPPGSYGVMSWWDYGHLITNHAERIPHSNPFQQNARSAAHYLLAHSEEAANLHLDAIEATGDGVSTNDIEELQEILAAHDDELNKDMRYVMVEDQMVAGKFSALTEWTGEGTAPYLESASLQVGGDTDQRTVWSDRFYDTIMAQMYHDDGANLDHYRLVHESADEFSLVGFMTDDGISLHQSLRLNSHIGHLFDAEDYRNVELSHPDIGTIPYDLHDVNRQLADASRNDRVTSPFGIGLLEAWDATIQPTVKTYERVDGALLTGTVDVPESHVVVEVDVETNANRSFVYRNIVQADADGNFEVRVPYATEHDLSVEDGYTEPVVETGDHVHVSTLSELDDADLAEAEDQNVRLAEVVRDQIDQIATVAVTESEVYDGDEIAVSLEDRPVFEISDLDAPDEVEVDETFNITADITNIGSVADIQPITLSGNGAEVEQRTLTLEPGASDTITFEYAFENATTAEFELATLADSVSFTLTATEVADNNETDSSTPAIRIGIP